MTFVSVEFLLLFAFVLGLYYFLPHRPQNLLLLIASLFFYGWWDWRFVGLLLATSCMDFYVARWVDPLRRPDASQRQRKAILIFAMIGNLAVLGLFKYYNFFAASLARALGEIGWTVSLPFLEVILPLGISFFTFHEMSYTIDVYRGEFRSVDSFLDYLLYVCFFPHLVAGPIQRATNLLPQIQTPRRFAWANIFSGLQLSLIGFFKKMVIADNLAGMVATLYTSPPHGAGVIVGTYAFAFQIYCDFSGYTDIARGTARMLGISIPLNFNLPYLAENIREFWKRWHISLSTWLKDYLYIPLGGSRKGLSGTLRNLMITMTLGGLWHGASWHFVFWGIYNGFLLCAMHLWDRAESSKSTPNRGFAYWVRVILLFNVVCVGWSLFRADTMSQWLHLGSIVLQDTDPKNFLSSWSIKLLILALPLIGMEIFQSRSKDLEPWVRWPVGGKVAFYLVIGYTILWFGSPVQAPFIYFQF